MTLAYTRHSWQRKTAIFICTSAMIAGLLPPVPVFAAQVTADSLSAYWKFDETSAGTFANSSGDTGATATGAGSSGTNNTPQPSTDVPSAISFTDARSIGLDGTDDSLSFGSFTPQARTIAFWLKLREDANGPIIYAGADAWDTAQWTWAVYQFPGSQLYFSTGTGASNLNDNGFSLNTWYHYVMVRNDGGLFKLYKNGVLQSSTSDSTVVNSVLRIGKAGSEYFNGLMDDLRIYNRTLSASEIAELAAGRHIPAYWKGKSGEGFERKQNWSGSYIPDPYSRIVLRASTGSLTLTGAIKYAGLTINSGALMKLNGTGTTMNDAGTFTNYGTLALRNSETLTNFTNDTAKGTIMLIGTGTTTGLKTGASYYNLTLNDGLLGYWKFDETSETRAIDSSGYGNSGSLLNAPTISTSVPPLNFHNPRSLSLDGTDDAVYMGDSALLQPNTITVSAWFKTTNASYQRIIRKRWYGYSLNMSSGQVVTDIWEADGTSLTVTSPSTYNDGAWHNAVFTYDGTNVILYVDGVRVGKTVGSGTRTIYYTAGGLAIGRDGDNAGDYFSGNIDDVRIYNRPLSRGEVAALAAGSQPSLQLGIITLNDTLDVNNHLTLNGGTLDVSSSNYGVTVGGSWLNNGGKFVARKGTVTFDGTVAGLDVLSGGQRFNNLTLNGAGTWNTRDRLTASGSLALSVGTLDASGSYVIRAGTVTQTSGTFVPRTGTLILTSSADATSIITDDLYKLRVEDSTELGLVGYWKFDEGTNTGAILDSSGNGNIGVRTGTGLVWTGSTIPSAISFENPFAAKFNGLTDVIRIPTNATLQDWSVGYTYSIWIKRSISNSSEEGILSHGSESNQGVALVLIANKPSFWLPTYSIMEGTAITDTNWHLLTGVFDNTNNTLKLYVDGTLNASAAETHTPLTPTGYVTIGNETDNVTRGFKGMLDDARVYNRPLSAEEVLNLYRGRYAAGNSSTATVTLGSDTSTAYLALDSGNLSVGTYTLNVTNSLSMLRGRGNLTLGSAATTLGGLIMSGATLTSAAGTLDINGDLTFQTGSLIAPSGYLTLSGNWVKTGGYFSPNGGSVQLDGGSQTLAGVDTFYNLRKSVTSAATLTFGAGQTVAINGALILNGAASNALSLRSSTTGVAWLLNAIGTRGVEYVDVKDSQNIHATAMDCEDFGCIDSGGNTNWIFDGPLATVSQARGGQGGDTTQVGGVRGKGSTLIMALRARAGLVDQYNQTVVRTDDEDVHEEASPAGSSTALVTVPAGEPVIERQRNRVVLATGDNRLIYKDVLADAWYAPYVSKVIQDDVARGYKDEQGKLTGEFGVAKPVTNAEILKMALEAAGKNDLKASAPRNKTAQGSWAAAYVGIAESLALTGYSPTTDVHASATRGQVVQLIMETMGITIGKTAANYSDVPANHPNSHAIAAATFFGLIIGDTKADGTPLNTFRPDDLINRAEASKLISMARALKKMGAIAPPAMGGIEASSSSSADSSVSSASVVPEMKQAKVIAQQLKVRVDSRVNADWIATIYYGHIVTVLWPVDNGWSYIKTVYGKEGYVPSEFLEAIQ